MAVVKYEWSDQYIQNNVEPFLHAFPILFSIIMGIIRFVNNNYNDIGYGTCRRPVYNVSSKTNKDDYPTGKLHGLTFFCLFISEMDSRRTAQLLIMT